MSLHRDGTVSGQGVDRKGGVSRRRADPVLDGRQTWKRGGRPGIHAWRGSTDGSDVPAWRRSIDGSGATSPSVEGLPRQGRGEAGKGRGPNVAQQRLGRSAHSALRVPSQITEKGCPKAAFFSYLAERGGLSGASMHPIPVRAAPRDPPSAVRFCSCRTVEPRQGFSRPMLSASQIKKPPRGRLLHLSGGERGIRTPEARFRRLHTFQACSFNHSDTSPDPCHRQTPQQGRRF